MAFPKGVKRDFAALEKRRREAVRLVFEEGLSQSEAARRVGAAQQSVNGWVKRYREEGQAGLRQAGRAGRKPLLSREQLAELEQLLLAGPEAHGFPAPLWTCPRVAALIRERFGVRYHEGHVWRLLRALNWSPQRPFGKARERNEAAIREWKHKTWPAVKKKAQKQDRTIVFIDESGLSLKPHRSRTWAPRGKTPVLEFNFNWTRLSAAAGLTFRNF